MGWPSDVRRAARGLQVYIQNYYYGGATYLRPEWLILN